MPTVESFRLHLPEPYLRMVRKILRDYLPDAEVWAYGSRVNGDYYDTSDLDLVVRQPDDLRRRQPHLSDVVEAFSESNLPIIVQLMDWAAIPASFHDEIAAKYVVLQSGNQAVDSTEAAGGVIVTRDSEGDRRRQ